MPNRQTRVASPLALIVGMMVLSATTAPTHARAQTHKVVLGATAGLAAGAWWTMSLAAARARDGDVLFTPSDLVSTAIPMVGLGLAAGLTTGIVDGDRLTPALGMGLVGWFGGFGLGYVVGDAIWEDEAGKWAGAVIGAGAGLVIGALIGGRMTGVADENAPPSTQAALLSFQHSFRIGT